MIPVNIAQVIKEAISDDRLDLHVALPGRIQKVNSDKSLDVVICVKRLIPKQGGFTEEEYPVLKGIKLAVWRTKKCFIWAPPEKGDEGLVVFVESSISQWFAEGTIEIPEDPGRHTLSNGIFIPCLTTDSETSALSPQKNGLVVGYKDGAYVAVENDGTITAENNAGDFTLKASGQFSVNGGNLTVDP